MRVLSLPSLALCLILATSLVFAQPPTGGGGGGMQEPTTSTCPSNGGFTGTAAYMGGGKAAPLLGAVACIDDPKNTTDERGMFVAYASLIYGPMEAGFTSDQLSNLAGCTTTGSVPGGVDTNTAEKIVHKLCGSSYELLNPCGGHATPFHYHEKFTCLYNTTTTGHSSRFATALDGNGVYGPFIDGGVLPTDLDACGGRTGVTPDSNGASVYYYPVTTVAPFSIGCFGPVATFEECRKLYPNDCGDDITTLETTDGTVQYDLWCPCYNGAGENFVAGENSTSASIATAPSLILALLAALLSFCLTL